MHASLDQPELIVLIHGISSSRWFLWPLAKRLETAGYETRLWTYFTLWGSNRQTGRRFAAQLRQYSASGRYARIHVVAHSMGSIVTRCAFDEELPLELGRVVMIGPPNRGSHVATRVSRLYGWFSSTLVELSHKPDSFVNRLPGLPSGVEVGVLAPSHDRMVRQESMRVEGQRDHRAIRGMHTASLWTRECADQVQSFLQHGTFQPVADCELEI